MLTVAKPSLTVAKTQPHRPHLTIADPPCLIVANPLRSHQLVIVRLLQRAMVCDDSAHWPFAMVQLAGHSRHFNSPAVHDTLVLCRPFARLQSFANCSWRFSPSHYLRRFRRCFSPSHHRYFYLFIYFYRCDWLLSQVSFKRRIVESDLFEGFGFFVKFWFIVDVWIHFYIQQLLVWKFILWTFSLTVGKSVSTTGT